MIRSITFKSQKNAELEPARPDLAIVSITTPGAFPADVPKVPHLLRLEFHDVEEGDEPWIWFSDEQADIVVNWLNALHSNADAVDLLVHCKAGISRSAAVALYAHDIANCEFPRRRFAGFANRSMLRKLEQRHGRAIPIPRALIRRENFAVRTFRDFEAGTSLVTVENRWGDVETVEVPISQEGEAIGRLCEQVAGMDNKSTPPAHQVQDWDFNNRRNR